MLFNKERGKLGNMTSCFLKKIPPPPHKASKKRRDAGEGTSAYSCYNASDDGNQIELQMFHNININYKRIKSIWCSLIF